MQLGILVELAALEEVMLLGSLLTHWEGLSVAISYFSTASNSTAALQASYSVSPISLSGATEQCDLNPKSTYSESFIA